MQCRSLKFLSELCTLRKLNALTSRNMCIIFIHDGSNDLDSDYSLIVASNRDEMFRRPARGLAPWPEDSNVIGGKDLEAGGTWLALSPLRSKIAALLNLPSSENNPNVKSRGELVSNYVMSDTPAKDYAEEVKSESKEYNNFILVTIELSPTPTVQTYTNVNDTITRWSEPYLGFSNSLPDTPLMKVLHGRNKFKEICTSYNKSNDKRLLVDRLVELLKDRESHFPDPVLSEIRKGMDINYMKALSSVFVYMPQGYGTRTHTIILASKSGQMEVVEVTMNTDTGCSVWNTTEMHFDLTETRYL